MTTTNPWRCKGLQSVALFTFLLPFMFAAPLRAQDTSEVRLKLWVPLLDAPQNFDLPYMYPSMGQAVALSKDFYELGFWGIDVLGDGLFKPATHPEQRWRKWSGFAFKYAAGLAFSRFGSELPIPLGVWAHEEFHRAVIGTTGFHTMNGNWIFHRWDGTVYGLSDEEMSELKSAKPGELLYSYVAGVQYEVLLNQQLSLEHFQDRRSHYQNALLLYNAYYVYNYFNFSASAASDTVKTIAPEHESDIPSERDFAGADLTAWAYDMFNPALAYTLRDSFPGGEGVNRRIGFFTDLSPEARDFLEEQKQLSLLNFLNPAIFLVNRIRIGESVSFTAFAQYAPTHFGSNVAVFVPFSFRNLHSHVAFHRYANLGSTGFGGEAGLYKMRLNKNISLDAIVHFWDQPKSFYGTSYNTGGACSITGNYSFGGRLSVFTQVTAKTRGWLMGNPYLDENVSVQGGLAYVVRKG